jgi:hypothetical protein
MKKKQASSEEVRFTIVWQTSVPTNTTENVVNFPQKQQDAIYQELSIHTEKEPVKLKIFSSGFGRTTRTSSADMQLAA